jgi:hypothetical protein
MDWIKWCLQKDTFEEVRSVFRNIRRTLELGNLLGTPTHHYIEWLAYVAFLVSLKYTFIKFIVS